MLESLSKEAVVQMSSVKRVSLKISKNTFTYTLVVASVSDTVKCVQAVRLATLLKRDPSTGVSEPAIFRFSTK